MKKHRWLLAALAASVALNLGFVGAWAYHFLYVRPTLERLQRPGEQARVRQAAWERWANENLAPQQRQRIRAQQEALRGRLKGASRRTSDAQGRFFDLLAAPQADPAALQRARDEIAAGQKEMRRLVYEHVLRLSNSLNPQQRRELIGMLRGQRGRFGIPGGGMRRRPMGPDRPPGRPGPREPERPQDGRNSSLRTGATGLAVQRAERTLLRGKEEQDR